MSMSSLAHVGARNAGVKGRPEEGMERLKGERHVVERANKQQNRGGIEGGSGGVYKFKLGAHGRGEAISSRMASLSGTSGKVVQEGYFFWEGNYALIKHCTEISYP